LSLASSPGRRVHNTQIGEKRSREVDDHPAVDRVIVEEQLQRELCRRLPVERLRRAQRFTPTAISL
jgi:hypothetical protein